MIYGRPALRILALVVDLSLVYMTQFVGAYLGGFIAVFVLSFQRVPEPYLERAAAGGMFFGLLFWGAAAWFLNFVVLQGLIGSSFGKYVFNLKVVNVDGSAMGVGKAFVRSLCYGVSAFPLYYGFLASLWDPRGQCWHDRICGTLVIGTESIAMAQVLALPVLSKENDEQKDQSAA